MVALTVGMATYNDFDGVYFTLQALRLYQDMTDTELLVVDNYGCDHTKSIVEDWVHGRYVRATNIVGTAAAKNVVFEEATGDAVLCCDSHVLFAPGVIARLQAYYRDHPDCPDLLQGPLVYDDLQNVSTHFDPVWRGQMWGTWATDPRGTDPEGEPFDIPMQGMGAFSCRKEAWPGFNPAFRGFGGEEGYIHEKIRQAGGRALCLPWLRWVHRFGRPAGVPYPLTVEDKFRNYVIGYTELGLDLAPVLEHFAGHLPETTISTVAEQAFREGVSGVGPFAPVLAPAHPAPAPGNTGDSQAQEPPQLAGEPEPPLRTPASSDTHLERSAGQGPPLAGRRAIVCYVGDKPHLIQQALALRHSWLYTQSPDTDLVMMGPAHVLDHLPDDIVKVEQRSVKHDPEWHGYVFADSITCMNGAGATQLDCYTHIMRTDVDTFITPAWNDFYPATFTYGVGGYANDDNVRQRIRDISATYGLVHRGLTNVGSTWYGPTDVIRRACAFSEMLMKHLLSEHFAADEGQWPGWYRGVSSMYAGEIAVNHCAPDAQSSRQFDAPSTLAEPITQYAHMHCWHTDQKFSKHAFMAGKYREEDAQDLDLNVIHDYCLAMSFRSLKNLAPAPLAE